MTAEDPKDNDTPSEIVGAAKPSVEWARPVKGIAENIRVRAMALVSLGWFGGLALNLPFAPVIDALRSQFHQGKLAADKIKMADHESAHFLLSLLNNDPMADLWLNPHGEQVGMALGLPAGAVSAEYSSRYSFKRSMIPQIFVGLVKPSVFDASKLSDEQIVKHVFMLIAGDAMSVDGEEKESVHGSFIADFYNTDMAEVEEILQTTKYKNLANSISALLIERLMGFLKDPVVRKVVDIFSVKLLESGHIHKKGESIVPMMMELLEENGVSKADFEGFQKKYDEMVAATVEEMRRLVG